MPSLLITLLTTLFLLLTTTTSLPTTSTSSHNSPNIHPLSAPIPLTPDRSGAYPRITRLHDTSLLAGYLATEANNTLSVLRTARSTDHGATWHPHGVVRRAPASTHDLDNPFPLQLPGTNPGRLLYAYRNHDRRGRSADSGYVDEAAYTAYRISVSYSDDGGETWGFLSHVEERVPDGGFNGLWEPFLRLARNGSVQCFYSAEDAADDQNGRMRASEDGGRTWGPVTVVSGWGRAVRDGMIGVAPVGRGEEGGLVQVFEENALNNRFSISMVTSTDDGWTWNNDRRRIYVARKRQAGAPQICNVGGVLVVSFQTNESAGSDDVIAGAEAKVIVSRDNGETWSESTVVGAYPAHWPGLFALDDSRFLALYSRDEDGAMSRVYTVD